MNVIRSRFYISDECDTVVRKLSAAVEFFEKGKFSDAERIVTEVLRDSEDALEKCSVDLAQLRSTIEQYQMLQVHPPQDFDPCIAV